MDHDQEGDGTFIPSDSDLAGGMQKEAERWDQVIVRLSRLLKEKEARAARLQAHVNIYDGKLATLSMELEQLRAQKLGMTWIFFIIGLFVLTLHCYEKRAYPLAAANFYAFMINWRMIYLRGARHSFPVGLVIMVVTLLFIYWA